LRTGLRFMIALLLLVVPWIAGRESVPRTLASAPPSSHESINTNLSDYVWPTDAGNIGTSTFGEYRRTHFHEGIDISTGNRTGFRVFAVRDGYVARIRVSPVGYGKMLYVRHADGYYSTYAHLSHFNAGIDSVARREQLKEGCFSVDIDCPPNLLPVRKGEIIAYTGDTGIGTPHLHFEIRDENLEPINPLLCTDFSFPDRIAPTIKKVEISPLGDRSEVNGSRFPCIFAVRPLRKNVYRVAGTIRLSGELGFGISASDLSNGSGYKHGVYSHQLYIDDKLLYAVQMDRVPARNAHEIGLYYDWSLRDQGRGRFEKLYADSPSNLLFYSPRKAGAGIVNASEFPGGTHTFRIVCTDFNDNKSEVTGNLVFSRPPMVEIEQHNSDVRLRFDDIGNVARVLVSTRKHGAETWDLKTMTPSSSTAGGIMQIPATAGAVDVVKVVAVDSHGSTSQPAFCFLRKPDGPSGSITVSHDVESDFVRVRIKAARPITAIPSVAVYEGDSRRTIAMIPAAIDVYEGSFSPLDSFAGTRRIAAEVEVNGHKQTAVDEFELYPIPAGRSGSFSLDGGKCILRYDSASVFKTVLLQVEGSRDDEPSYVLLPENTVLRGSLQVTMTAAQARPGQGLFFSGIGGWELLDKSPSDNGTVFTGSITRTLGEVVIKTDETPPGISRLTVGGGGSRRPAFSFRFGDNLSGIEYKGLKTYIDDTIVIPEVDGEHHKVTYKADHPLERGSHRLTIQIVDKMGNSNRMERRFSIR